MTLQVGTALRATRAPAPTRSRLPSGQLRAPGRAYADDPRPTLAELISAPLDFARDRTDLPCQQPTANPEWWFPVGSTGPAYRAQLEAAKARCRPCPVRAACRDYAVRHGQQGIWGGTSEEDRREIRRRRAV
jgi:WhiB family transcriptional regulator, redox-sensing transcriptional regulator